MTNYALRIPIANAKGINRQDVDKILVRTFRSIDFMERYLEGYLFGNYRLQTLKDFEQWLSINPLSMKDYWLFFLTVEPEED